MPPEFDPEKHTVSQRALEFIEWATPLPDDLPKILAAQNQLDRDSTAIVFNIAEGNGKLGPADRFKFFEITRGSAVGCGACLDILVRKKRCTLDQTVKGVALLHEIVAMLIGLLKRNGQGRLKQAGKV